MIPVFALGDVLRSTWWLDKMYLALELAKIQKTMKAKKVFIVQQSFYEWMAFSNITAFLLVTEALM